jgi:hypothetical protein
MLHYDHDRTTTIVHRLKMAKVYVTRFICVAASAFGGTCGALMAAYMSGGALAAIIAGWSGMVVGWMLAAFANLWFEVAVEWMCQMLIAQGHLIEVARREDYASKFSP